MEISAFFSREDDGNEESSANPAPGAEALMEKLRKNPRLLGDILWTYYQQDLDDPELLDRSIEATQNAVELSSGPGDHDLLFDLGIRMDSRFQLVGNLDDLNAAIAAYQRALELTPSDDQDLLIRFNRLSASLFKRYKRIDSISDLDEAISVSLKAIELMPDSHVYRPSLLSNHGGFLLSRFERIDDVNDLERSISNVQEAIDIAPEGHPETSFWMTNLGNSCRERYERSGDVKDLERALKSHIRAVELTADDHPMKPTWLNNLGITFCTHYNHTGASDVLEQSISSHRRAIELSSNLTYDPIRPGMYSNLGDSLEQHFARTGDLKDLEDALVSHRQACELPEDNLALKAMRYHNLGNAFLKRFVRTRETNDLESSVSSYRRAVSIVPQDHPSQPVYLANLSNSLSARYEHTYSGSDLGDAIEIARRAVELTPDDDSEKPYRLGVLCSHLSARFELTGEPDDIESAILAGRRALESDSQRSLAANRATGDLAVALWRRCERMGDVQDVTAAIGLLKSRIETFPDDHPYIVSQLRNLGGAQGLLLQHSPNQSTFDAAIQTYMDATQKMYANPSIRMSCAISCVTLHDQYPAFSSTDALIAAHSRVLSILPEFVWLGYDVRRRYNQSAGMGGLINNAVSAAIRAGNLPQAVEWHEAGRSLVWYQILSLRAPLDELREIRADLAESLEKIQLKLRSSASTVFIPDSNSFNGVQGITTDESADRHRRLVIEHDKLMQTIRTCSGLETFMLPATFASLKPSAELANGPVVIINVHWSRCDALILFPGGAVTPVYLPDLSLELATRLRSLWTEGLTGIRDRAGPLSQETSNSVDSAPVRADRDRGTTLYRHSHRVDDDGDVFHRLLEHLWRSVVSPIIEVLKTTMEPHTNELVHVTWCPTGPLTQLPLHAAGIYGEPNGPRVYDFLVSSYTPSLTAFLRSCRGAAQNRPIPKALIVSQPETPGHSRLPGTKAEGQRLQAVLDETGVESQFFDHESAAVESVRSVMGQISWLHLACHGSQHRGDPTQSAFALYDGSLSLLDLMRTVSDDAELAFLSACQTATGDASNPEESAHLAAGMLAVGFKGVVATMWSIQDADAPIVVEEFYKELLRLRGAGAVGKGQTGAAYALHEATRVLKEKVGENNFTRWVPFVHFGV